MRTIDAVKQDKNDQQNYDYNNDVYFQDQEPLMLRNLRTPGSGNSSQDNQK